MASSWRIGKRNFRSKVPIDPEDLYRLDSKKSSAENAFDIYGMLCNREIRDAKRLFLLNGFTSLLQQSKTSNLGFNIEEILYCLSASLIHNFTQVRAATLRSIRYALSSPKDIKIFNSMQLQHLVCRSVDVLLKNDDERVQGMKLIRKMLAISPEDISPVLVRCLVSLADSGYEDGDSMLRTCLATLCELAVLNPTLLIVCGGVSSITRNVLECHNPRIAESLCGVLLYLLEWPQTRAISGVRLDCLAAPYCDFTYRLGIMDKNKDARELRYTSSRLALLSVLRSWTGTIEFCDPSKPSGLKAIVDVLYLNQLEVRKAILDLLYEILGLPQPIWTDEYSVALQTVDPSDFQDSWLLSNGFVAMEGRFILPTLASASPNICEQHLALLLYCFIETGLLNALVEVIASSDTFISVRATVLVGKLLHLMHTHLPADICSTSPALPTLIAHATQGNHQANAAISALQKFHQILRNRPASCSLFLDSIIQGGALINTRLFKRDINIQNSSVFVQQQQRNLERRHLDSVSSSDESMSISSSSRRSSFRLKRKLIPYFENIRVNRLIRDSNVLALADGNSWDWEIVTTILKSDSIRKLDDTQVKFLKRLVHYFKPSSNRFSHQDLAHSRTVPAFVTAGLDLIDWLLSSNELESMRMLTDLFSDISQQLLVITTSNRAHDCLFSPQHMNNTMCQQYFLFMGRMCRVEKGISVLTNAAVFEQLNNLVKNTGHVCYVKLIVSGLDYSLESITRKVLENALTLCKMRSGRLYATQFMIVLLRARIPNFEVWGIPLLIQQTKDPERSIVLSAMDALNEACYEKNYLEELVSLWPNLYSLGDVGHLLMARYYSISRGLNHRKAKIKEEIEFWKNGYNKRYVLLVEADTHSSLTLHIKNEDGYYSRRNCSSRPIVIPPDIQPHLYGQIVQTAQGMSALLKNGNVEQLIDVLNKGKCSDETECLELKAAIWALGHMSTHSNGIEYFLESGSRIYEKLIILATKCEVFSIRATCFNVLGLIAGTNGGANLLFKLNWLSVRHDRNTIWPVHRPEDWLSNNYTPVRHHYEDMPPYNYSGIEDQMDGSFYTGSYWNLLLDNNTSTTTDHQDTNTNFDINKSVGVSVIGDEVQVSAATKSKTLPESSYSKYGKHTRSLSESKTTDAISFISGPHHSQLHQHRIRYNSCTDSNTSGVSSCESVTGRAPAVGEYQQIPLSPIPSMSNLLDIAPQALRLRRTSLIGTSYSQTSISPLDIEGYAKLRSLRRHCRPVLSESAADELADIIDRNEIFSSFRPRKSSLGESQRKMKVRSLDRQSSLRMFTQLDVEELQVPLPTLAAPKFLSQNDTKGPCYSGICLPKNLLDLFPTRNLTRSYVSRDIHDQDLMDINLLTAKQQFLNDSVNEGDESSVISSLSDVSSVSKRSKWIGKHGRGSCLLCSRSRRNRKHPHRLDSESNIFSMRKPKSNQSSSIQLSDISFNSPESIISEESMPDRLTANILYHVQRLSNPVSCKQSKSSLLELKQKHPASFQDICLYSEVCKSLGRSTYRMSARRFLQELFLDINFDSFYVEPTEILSRKDRDICIAATTKFKREQDNTILDVNMSAFGSTVQFSTSHEMQLHFPQTCLTTSSGVAGGTGGGAGVSLAHSAALSTGSTFPAHKSHVKSPPLESVYETSCENLLSDSIPSSKTSITCNRVSLVSTITDEVHQKSLPLQNRTQQSTNTTTATTTVALVDNIPITSSIPTTSNTNSCSITSSSNSSSSYSSCSNSNLVIFRGNSNQQPDEPLNDDHFYDGVSRLKHFKATSTTTYSSSNPAITSSNNSNCNSNRSSINSKHYIENENKKYTRGRFYTLELDLSCTKNKFPITHRRKDTTVNSTTCSQEAYALLPQITNNLRISDDVDSAIVLKADTACATAAGQPTAERSKSKHLSQTVTITKSLASSLAKPIGSLYCEKRLQSSKSEAVLSRSTKQN